MTYFRELPNIPIIKNGGWHFSYFGDVEFIKNKLRNFTHEELNNDFMLNDERITKQIKNSSDLFVLTMFTPTRVRVIRSGVTGVLCQRGQFSRFNADFPGWK